MPRRGNWVWGAGHATLFRVSLKWTSRPGLSGSKKVQRPLTSVDTAQLSLGPIQISKTVYQTYADLEIDKISGIYSFPDEKKKKCWSMHVLFSCVWIHSGIRNAMTLATAKSKKIMTHHLEHFFFSKRCVQIMKLETEQPRYKFETLVTNPC